MVRRRFPERPIAAAKQANATNGNTHARVWRKSTNPWTLVRSSDWNNTNSWLPAGGSTSSPESFSSTSTFRCCLQPSISMLSFAPDASTFGCSTSTLSAGSFCLFCENGVGGLPTLTRTSAANAPPAALTADHN